MKNFNLRQIWLICSYSMRNSLRTGGGIIYIVAMVVGGLLVTSIFVNEIDRLIDKADPTGSVDRSVLREMVVGEVVKSPMVSGLVEWFTGDDNSQTEFLLSDKPALLSVIVLVLLMLTPYSNCLGGFNQTSGDIGSKGLRFLLMRTERTNVFLGRFLGVVLFAFISTILFVAVVVSYIHFKFQIYPLGALLSWGLQGIFAIMILSLPYFALCAWISGKTGAPFGSLALCFLLVLGVIVVLLLVQRPLASLFQTEPEKLDWIMRLLPWGWKYDLLHQNLGKRFLAISMQLGFTAVFLFLGLRSFNRRDV